MICNNHRKIKGNERNKLTELELYYNKFNEEKRLDSRHGQVEFITSMKYLHKYLTQLEAAMPKSEIKILDVGAATGRYSVPLVEEGYDDKKIGRVAEIIRIHSDKDMTEPLSI